MIDAIIVSAGSGKRMKTDKNKQLLKIAGKPVFIWALEAFKNTKKVDRINLVIRLEDEEEIVYYLKKFGIQVTLHYGGDERQDSIYNCIRSLTESEKVLVHDGARPFISTEIIERCIDELDNSQGVCVGMPVKDTIKVVGEGNEIEFTPNRSSLWMAQTPQCFDYDTISKAYDMAYEKGLYFTDDSSLVQEMLGIKVKMIEGDYTNIKITTPEDLPISMMIAESVL